MITTTAMFIEYLVIGCAAWLWLLPLAPPLFGSSTSELTTVFLQATTPLLALALIVTYTLGVLTESVSFALEKLLVGRTSNPRSWYSAAFGSLDEHDWFSAQREIWSSEGAFREFIYNRVRITISRGIASNCIGSLLVTPLTLLSPLHMERAGTLVIVSVILFLLSALSWWWATSEYRSRVRVAGRLAGTTGTPEKRAPQ